MAWQYPTHVCGHSGERYQAYGKSADRAYKLRQVESQLCTECRKAEADKVAAEAGLVPLRGTAKQVAWASEIRERALRLSTAEQASKLKPEASAGWWIENRHRW